MANSSAAQRWLSALVPLAGIACGGVAGSADSDALRAPVQLGAQLTAPVHHDQSAPLSLIRPPAPVAAPDHEPMPVPFHRTSTALRPDTKVQSSMPAPLMPSLGVAFEAQGQDFTGPSGSFSIIGVPPDTNGDVGPNHYVQTVNSDLTVFDKTGKALLGPVQINTLFSGFGGFCQDHNDGDPVVLYDPMADRWVISQFAITMPDASGKWPPGAQFFHCIAVSTTPDPTGSYSRYAYQYDKMDDYPKMGIWPDAYYQTFNFFDVTAANTPFVGAKICAYDRASMLAGKAANQQCFQTTADYGAVLPADLDGKTLPPAGAPNTMLALFDNNNLAYWQFHVDWQNPSNTKLTGPVNIPVNNYTPACDGQATNTCIPQAGTTQQLDALSDRLMFRLAYRNFGDHEAMVVTHAITAGTSVGVRWYELRFQNGAPVIYQQSTYAPDQNFRWMGSAAFDKAGDIVIGFSESGSGIKPAIHLAGRLATDPLNTLARGETTLIDGTGAQLPMYGGLQPLSRWGDYSMMSVDPSDECTFWYTDEYIKTDGSANWHTRVGTLKVPGCDGSTTPPTQTATLTWPQAGATLSGTVQLSGEASSGKPITKIDFMVDGQLVGSGNASPASVNWDTRSVADGSHSITVKATDSSGWTGTSAAVSATISNSSSGGGGGGGNCPPGTTDVGGVCIPTGCNSTGSGALGFLALAGGVVIALSRRRRG